VHPHGCIIRIYHDARSPEVPGSRLLCICWVHSWTDRNVWYTVVGIATLLRPEWSGVQMSVKTRLFLMSRPTLEPTQSVFWRQSGHSVTLSTPLPSAEVKNKWSYNSTPPVYLHCMNENSMTSY